MATRNSLTDKSADLVDLVEVAQCRLEQALTMVSTLQLAAKQATADDLGTLAAMLDVLHEHLDRSAGNVRDDLEALQVKAAA